MFNTNSPRFVVLLTAMLLSLTVAGQQTKEALILYNTQPVKAEVTSTGEVVKVISQEPDQLQGFTLKVMDYAKYLDEANKEKQTLPASQAYSIESVDGILVPFDSGHATLSDVAISRLDEVIRELNADSRAVALIRTFSVINESPLHKNRLSSIKTYFKIRGIGESRFVFENLIGERNFDEIKISFLK